MIYTPFIWPLVLEVILLVGIAAQVRRFRDVSAVQPFLILVCLGAFYAIFSALLISTASLSLRTLWLQLLFLCVALMPPALLALTLEYIGQGGWLTLRRFLLLLIIPVVSIVLALTSHFPLLFRYDFGSMAADLLPVSFAAQGVWFWVHFVYSEILLLIACGLLISSMRTRAQHARNTLLILLGIMIPMVLNALSQFGVTPIWGYNLTVTLFIVIDLLCVWALLRFQMFNVMPVARDAVMEHISDLVIVLDIHGHIVDFNRAAQVACQLSPRHIGARPDALPATWADIFRSHPENLPCNEEITVNANDQQRCYDLSISPIQDTRGGMLGRLFVLHDITERRQAAQALYESEERFRLMVDVAPVPLFLVRLSDHTFQYVNSLAAKLISLPQEEAIGRKATDFYADPAHRPSIVGEILRTGSISHREVLLKRANGETFWGLISSALTDFKGERVILSGITDITERKQAEEALRQSEKQYRLLAENMEDVVWTLDPETMRFVYVSPSVERLRAYTAEEVIASPAADALMPHARQELIQLIQSRAEHCLAGQDGNHSYTDEIEQPCKDGASVWTEAVTHYYLNEETGKVEVHGVSRNITERRHATEAIRRRTAELAALYDTSLEINAQPDLHSLLEEIVRRAATLLNARMGDLYLLQPDGKTLERVVSHKLPGDHRGIPFRLAEGLSSRVARTGKPLMAENHRAGSDSSIDSVHGPFRRVLGVPLKVNQEVIGVINITDDQKTGPFCENEIRLVSAFAAQAAIAIKKARLVDKLVQLTNNLQARNDELDAYAHTVAHDLRNPIHATLLATEALNDFSGETCTSACYPMLQGITRNVQRMNTIVEELLVLAEVRKVEVRVEPLEMARIVADALDRVGDMARDCAAVIVQPEDWPAALGYAAWVEEVWVNYLSNAIKYGGEPPRVELGATTEAGGMVRFWVSDNGPGLSPEEQARLFVPFARLEQRPIQGYGLGLSIVRRIVNKLGGQVSITSEIGKGSTFSFSLPAAQIIPSD